MPTASPTKALQRLERFGLLGAAVIVMLPLAGLALAYAHPIGLIDAPPIHSERLLFATVQTVSLSLMVTAASLTLGSLFAWIQVRWQFWGSSLLTRLSILPLVLPSFLLAATLREGFAPLGSLGALLGSEAPFSGLGAAFLVLTLSCTPYVQLVVSAALMRLPAHAEEAAQTLGAPPSKVFWQVVFPALRPALGFAALLVVVYAAADFGAVAVMDVPVLTYELYQFAGRGGVQAPLIGLVLIGTIVPMIVLGRRLSGDQSRTQLSYGRTRYRSRRPAPRWGQLVGTTSLLLYLLLGLVLPLSLVAYWGLTLPLQGALHGPIITTLIVGTLGGIMSLLLGGFPAVLVSAQPKRSGLETLTFIGSGVPGVMIGYGLLQLALRLPDNPLRALAEGGGLLCLGLALRFASHGYAALKPALITQSQQSLDAARLLGAGSWRIARRIRLPHLAPALASGFLLSFVAIVKELPISLLLLPAGQTTLATRIFDAHDDAHLGDLGAASLWLLLMVLGAQVVLWRWSHHEH